MLSQSHSVNTSIESCVTHLLQWKESQSQSEKTHSVNGPLQSHRKAFLSNNTFPYDFASVWENDESAY